VGGWFVGKDGGKRVGKNGTDLEDLEIRFQDYLYRHRGDWYIDHL
jgi:hypothetical protein